MFKEDISSVGRGTLGRETVPLDRVWLRLLLESPLVRIEVSQTRRDENEDLLSFTTSVCLV